MTGPQYLAVVCFAFAALLFILTGRHQRRLWWKLEAWKYRDPNANEPSTDAYRATRGVSTAYGVVLVIFGLFLLGG